MDLLVAFHHVTLIDGTGREPVADATVAVREGHIVHAGQARTWLPSLQEDILNLDFSGKYLLPGLIDCHVQLARSGASDGRVDGDDGAVTLRMLHNARRNLAAGITTVRDLGGWRELELAVRGAIQRGEFCGPRLLLAGRHISSSEPAANQYPGMYRLARGVDEVRKAVREQLRRGADGVTLCAAGALLVHEDQPLATQYSADEIRMVVEEAGKSGRRVSAGAHGSECIRQAVMAGVHTIEHGSFLHKGREVIDEMKRRGTFLVPTLSAGRVLSNGSASKVPAWIVERMTEHYEAARKSLRLAYQAGVPIAMGSGAGTPLNRHGENGLELQCMQQAGMKPMDALVSSTLTAARALGRDSDLGSIEEGKLADFLVLDSDPLQDLSRLADRKQIRGVFMAGKLVARQPTDEYPRAILARDCLAVS